MIGNADHAATIAAMPLHEDDFSDFDGVAPEGFTYLSSGSYRHAFLGPDGVVYKVHTDLWRSEGHGGNDAEWVRYCEAPTFPEGLRLAECTLYTVNGESVMAMEYVAEKSAGRMLSDVYLLALRSFGIFDVTAHNVRQRDGELIVTDFAL